jgi:hypothetical protein
MCWPHAQLLKHLTVSIQVSPHVGAPLARVARNRGVSEEAYMQVRTAVSYLELAYDRVVDNYDLCL